MCCCYFNFFANSGISCSISDLYMLSAGSKSRSYPAASHLALLSCVNKRVINYDAASFCNMNSYIKDPFHSIKKNIL